MKKQIRNSVFETNSSSTHSIAISKKPVVIGNYVHFGIGEFGWENDCVNTADYLYTAILVQNESDALLKQLKNILDSYSIKYEFEEPEYIVSDEYKFLRYGYIDHSEEIGEFIFTVLNDENMLMRYLFGDSSVYTGNDNQDNNLSGCDIAKEYYYDWDGKKCLNPYHDAENYDYFYKGN